MTGSRPQGSLVVHVLRDHALLGALPAAWLASRLGAGDALLFWAANVLVDVDHYVSFLHWAGAAALRPHRIFHYARRVMAGAAARPFLDLEPFHTAEFALLLAAGGYPAGVAWLKPVLWGVLFHAAVDVVHLARHGLLATRCHSLAEYWLRRRAMERRGQFPALVQQQAAREALADCRGCGWPAPL